MVYWRIKTKGSFVLKDLFGNKVEKAHSKIKFLQHNNSYLEIWGVCN